MKKGFTLVELLVVVSIISILTVVTVSQFQTAKRKANDVQRKADLSSLSKALQMYYSDYGKFPLAVNGMISLDGTSGISWGGEFVDKGYVYMKVVPKENNSSLPKFCYVVSNDGKKTGLYSDLENTMDKDYYAAGYKCNNETYHFTIVSPNASTTDIDLQPK